MNNYVVLTGPFIGSWEQEILTFRPYVKWLCEALDDDIDVYVSSHSNRYFLYDWIDNDKFIQVYEMLSRDEQDQFKNIHNNINNKDYALLTKNIKNSIHLNYKSKIKIKTYTPNYTVKAISQIPTYNKIFKKIDVEKIPNDYIVFIPDIKEQEDVTESIYDYLNHHYNTIVIGDTFTHLHNKNIILKLIDYFENGYTYITEYITGAKAVICPAGHWAAIANMQSTPVFTWGEFTGQYSNHGIYNFNNNCMTMTTDSNTKASDIIKLVKFFIKTLEKTNNAAKSI